MAENDIETDTGRRRLSDRVSANEQRVSRNEELIVRFTVIQTIIASAAIVVAVVALYASFVQADAAQRQVQSAVWPRLLFERNYSAVEGDRYADITVTNAGIGPAKIRSVEVELDDRQVYNWWQLLRRLADDAPGAIFISNSDINGIVLPAEAERKMLRVDVDSFPELLRDAWDEGRVRLKVCYCSVFDTCWQYDSAMLDPDPVASCESAEPGF